ncbi:MAG: hypothetical protein LBV41_03675 [Cytophagaceae bacterium]|jgi:uncharacterized protein YjaG (DUF416 family)|nr:hypothetical protein [Cytophagaceae bacterium]
MEMSEIKPSTKAWIECGRMLPENIAFCSSLTFSADPIYQKLLIKNQIFKQLIIKVSLLQQSPAKVLKIYHP